MTKEKRPNIIPIILNAKTRTDDKVALVLAAKARLNDEFSRGKLTAEQIADLGIASFCRQAGVGENFLNGDLHRKTLKPRIKEFIKQLKARFAERSDQLLNAPTSADSEKELMTSNTRLRDMLHAARLQLHAKRQIIKSLSQSQSPTVVPLKPQDTP